MLSRRPSNYTTKQGEAVLAYIRSLKDRHVTASEIVEHFEKNDVSIGRTTIYRQLEKLVQDGKVRKYSFDLSAGACFQYVDECKFCEEHYHMKCENCGKIIHLQDEIMSAVAAHILRVHEFEVNVMKTVFYGKCRSCIQNA